MRQINGVAQQDSRAFGCAVSGCVNDNLLRINSVNKLEFQLAGSTSGTELNATTLASVVNLRCCRDRANQVSAGLDDVFNRGNSTTVVATFLARNVLEGDVHAIVRHNRSLTEHRYLVCVQVNSQFVLTCRSYAISSVGCLYKSIGYNSLVEEGSVGNTCITMSIHVIPSGLVRTFSQIGEECEISGVAGKGEDTFEYVVSSASHLLAYVRLPTGVVTHLIQMLDRHRNANVNLAVRRSRSNELVLSLRNRECIQALYRSRKKVQVVGYVECYTVNVGTDNSGLIHFGKRGFCATVVDRENNGGLVRTDGQ